MKFIISSCVLLFILPACLYAQDDLLSLIGNDKKEKEFVVNAFKSSRVINGHSMEFIGKGVMDVRILHRFGEISSGANNLWGLDQANMRFGFDFGLSRNLTIGIGRSNIGKEWDGFVKFRPVSQAKGYHAFPFSVVLVSGMTLGSAPWADKTRQNYFSSRLAFYNTVIIGRKFSEKFSLQVSPVFVHRNLAPTGEDNDVYAIGAGLRYKLSKRIALVADHHYVIRGINKTNYKNPLSVGLDIETGGHVFQLHFSNSNGMNEKAFITNTTGDWSKGEIRFGFNLSRVFTIAGR
jgi:hypothetical protein